MSAHRFPIAIIAALLALLLLSCGKDREYEYPSGYRVELFLMGGIFADNTGDRVHGGILQPTAMKNVPRLVPNDPYLRYDLPFATWNTDPYGYGEDYTPESIIDRHIKLYAVYGTYIYDEYSLREIECGNPDVAYVLSENINTRTPWEPLCPNPARPFKGHLYGKGHSISYTTRTSGNNIPEYGGLFAYMSYANVADLNISATAAGRLGAGAVAGHMEHSTVNKVRASGGIYAGTGVSISVAAGGLAGQMSELSKIVNSSFSGIVSVNSANSAAGGLAGYMIRSRIENSVSTARANVVSNNSAAGGVAGRADTSTIMSSFHRGQVSAADGARLMAGGIAGRTEDTSIISCYTDTLISAPENTSDTAAGGIAGFMTDSAISDSAALGNSVSGRKAARIAGDGTGITVTNSYARKDMLVNSVQTADTNLNGIGRSILDMRKNLGFFKDNLKMDFSLVWVYPEHYEYPRLEWERITPFIEISTPEELANVGHSSHTSHYYVLVKDLDFTDISWRRLASSPDSGFSGILDGNGHTVYNLSDPLFGYLSGSSIYDLTLRGSNGLIAGSMSGYGKLERINVDGKIKGERMMGGIAGETTDVIISHCTFFGDVHRDTSLNYDRDTASGGIVGSMSGGVIAYSSAAGISGMLSGDGTAYAGGLVGNAENVIAAYNYAVTDVYATGAIAANAGGLFGNLANSVSANSFAFGDIYAAARNYSSSSQLTAAAGGYAGRAADSRVMNSVSFSKNMRTEYYDVLGTGGAEGYASGFGGISVNSVYSNIYSNADAVLIADNTVSGEMGNAVSVSAIVPEQFYMNDLGWDFSEMWRLPSPGDLRLRENTEFTYPIFKRDKDIFIPLHGDEWYWFAFRKYYEEFAP
jgi:hypothetical protein